MKSFVWTALMASCVWGSGAQSRPVTIEDCIRLVRIQQTYDANDRTAVFSPDGRQWLTLIWRGNLEKNVNEYTLLLYDTQHPERGPKDVLRVEYTYDSHDPHARPLSQFAFLTGQRVASLATFEGKPRQAVSIDLQSGAVTPLTDHPGGLLSFAIAPDGQALVFAASAPEENLDRRKAVLKREGFSLEDSALIGGSSLPMIGSFGFLRPMVEYFVSAHPGHKPRMIYQGTDGRPDFWMSPNGRYAIVHPYLAEGTEKPTVGLIDMRSGSIEPLASGKLPAPGRVLWARDSGSVLIFSGSLGRGGALYEIALPSRQQIATLSLPPNWEVMNWGTRDSEVLLTRTGRARGGDPEHTLATLRRTAKGWEGPRPLARKQSRFDLNPRYYAGTNGRLIAGVKDHFDQPPELAVYDRASKRTTVLTDLNPQLRELDRGEISPMRWSGPYDKDTSFGYVIKPVGYAPGKRYPVIFQFKDEGYYPEDKSFIFDGAEQFSGAAMQVWANQGFVVLFAPSPLSLRAVIESPEEDERITAHVETGLDVLESQGLIDRSRAAITGWSRAGWWTQAVVTRAKTRFAAVSNIDNIEYNLVQYANAIISASARNVMQKHWGGSLPWGPTAQQWHAQAIDWKYANARTPRLYEIHGASGIPFYAGSYAALKTAGIPVEFYVYPDAAHDLKSPRHRYVSLSMQTDWFRFWLQDYVDPSPEKQTQYARWKKLREGPAEQ